MSTMHPHDYQHDHSREADDLVDEFKAIFQKARRGASDTLRAHRDRQARLDRAARDRRSAERDARTAGRDAERAERAAGGSPRGSDKTRVRVTDTSPNANGGVSDELIARWASAHAVADLFREEARAADARAAESKDSSAAAQSAKAHSDAETADAWASAWDDRVRAAGVDPDALAEDRDRERDRDIADPTRTPTQRDPGIEADRAAENDGAAEPAVFEADTGTDAEAFINRLAEVAGQMAIDTADDLDAATADTEPSVGELIAATHPPEGTTLTPAAETPSLSPDTAPDMGPAVDLDAGAGL